MISIFSLEMVFPLSREVQNLGVAQGVVKMTTLPKKPSGWAPSDFENIYVRKEISKSSRISPFKVFLRLEVVEKH